MPTFLSAECLVHKIKHNIWHFNTVFLGQAAGVKGISREQKNLMAHLDSKIK
jgi:hypothetical protein